MKPTIHLNLANFRLNKDGEQLEKFQPTFDSQPASPEVEQKQFKRVKQTLKLIKQEYFEDGAERIGVKVFYINPEIHNTLKEVLLFLHGNKDLQKVIIKYRKIEIHPGKGVKVGEIHGEG